MNTIIRVRVPATTANCGPGFDVMGLALNLYSTFEFEPHPTLAWEGCHPDYANPDNLIYRAFKFVFERAGVPVPGVKIRLDCAVPMARGLGSSSTCFVAGAMAANLWLKRPFSLDEIFAMTTAMEGHPDNVAPALFGQLNASFKSDDGLVRVTYAVNPSWRFVTIIPPYEVKTSEARAILPQEFPMGVVTHSVGHALAVTRAFETGDEVLLSRAYRDVLHEPYRAQLIPDYDEAKKVALMNGACAFFISGSGSTMMALTTQKSVAQKLETLYQERFPDFGVYVLEVDGVGAVASAH